MSLEAAVRIGESLVTTALWHDERCTWIGPVAPDSRDPHNAVYGSLGPDLYSGTTGIAWFLGYLYFATNIERFHIAAIGALRQSLFALRRIKRNEWWAFHAGAVGIAVAAVELSKRLNVPELETAARPLLCRVLERGRNGTPFDLVTGTAGAIVPLLNLAQQWPDDRLLEFARRLGDQTIRIAQQSWRGWSWPSPSEGPINLTGFSHGTAGIGCALMELFAATADHRYRAAAEAAFNYERSWFDAEQENWPDFRGISRKRPGRAPLPFSSYWCHGAPGIALSRIRAWELLRDSTARDEARAALRTTRLAVVSSIQSKRGEFSLCHGLAGNAEVLYEGRDINDNGDGVLEIVETAARVAEQRARLRRPGSPSLFLGSAGIGYLNLRLYDRTVPSLLLLRCNHAR